MVISRQRFNEICISFTFYLALIRSTNMGVGYPSSDALLGNISYLPQKYMQFLILALLFTLGFFSYLKKRPSFKLSIWVKLLIPIMLLSALLSPYPGLSFRYLLSVTVVTLPIYLYYHQFGPEALFDTLFKFLAFAVVINILYILLLPQYGIMTGIHSGTWRGLFEQKNGAGSFFAAISIFFIAKYWFSKHRAKLTPGLLALVSVVLVVMSQSATAIIMLTASILSFIFFYVLLSVTKKQKKIILLGFYILGIIVTFLLAKLFTDDILLLLGKDPTLSGRTGLWDVLLELSFNKPIFGYGLGLFSRPEIMYQYSSIFGWAAKSTHNSYLDVILGIGYLGFLITAVWFIQKITPMLMKKTLTLSYRVQIALALSTLFACLINAFSASGVILTNAFFWVLMLSMILFGASEESYETNDG